MNLISSAYIEPDIYHAERSELIYGAKNLLKGKTQLSRSISDNLTHLKEADKLQRFPPRKAAITEYEPELFLEYVETITVDDRDILTFNMKCGLNFTERAVLE